MFQLEEHEEEENRARAVQLVNGIELNGQAITLIDTPSLDKSMGYIIMREIFGILGCVLFALIFHKLSAFHSRPMGVKLDGVIYVQPNSSAWGTIPQSVRSLAMTLCIENDLRKLVIVRTWDEPGQCLDEDLEGAIIVNCPEFDQAEDMTIPRSMILNPIIGTCE